MRCPVCGALYIYHLDGVFTCTEGHRWAWTDQGLIVEAPPPTTWWLTVESPPEDEIATWEGEGGR